jgi:sterol desaturase/sphingolipid hydroxylase (fatty acid hydroxylase superfamily)
MLNYLEKIYNYLTQAIESGNTFLFIIALYIVMLISEWVILHFYKKQKWDYKDGLVNIVTGLIPVIKNFIFGNLLPFAIIILLYQNYRIFTIPVTWWGLIPAFLCYDFIAYLSHYLGHKTGLFWAFHQVHHSSEQFNPTLSSRFSLFDITLISKPLFYLVPLLGVSPIQYLLIGLIEGIWAIIQHSEAIRKLPFFDQFLSTPSNHRVHHGVNVKYLDRNFGEVFVFWDRIFGTFQKEEEKPEYGLTTNIKTYNIVKVQTSGLLWLFRQMRSTNKFSDKLKYLYMPPGWNHKGVGTSTKELRVKAKHDKEKAIQQLPVSISNHCIAPIVKN